MEKLEEGKDIKKGKEKMNGLLHNKHNYSSDEKRHEMFEFKFSNFQAIQVPKGWDKLFVSIIAIESGKTLTRSGKGSVDHDNGICEWEESLTSNCIIWISPHHHHHHEESLFRLVVAMGSIRFGTLGEATVNLASYVSSEVSIHLSLPLQKCDHRTILQVEIQCLTPRTKFRAEEWGETSIVEEMNVDYDDIENKSDISDHAFIKAISKSSAINILDPPQPYTKASLSASTSLGTFDSVQGSFCRENFSPRRKSNGISKKLTTRRQFLSQILDNPVPSHSLTDSSRSNHSSSGSKIVGPGTSGTRFQYQREEDVEQLLNEGSTKGVLNAAKATIELLQAETRMWEQSSRTKMEELDKLENELSSSHTECDALRHENEQLRIRVEELMAKPKAAENPLFQSMEGEINIQRQWEDEIKLNKETNANLALQLKQSQEANMELVSVLQDMEDTMEKQNTEIINLSKAKSDTEYLETETDGSEEYEENHVRNLEARLEEMQEFQKEIESKLQMSEEILEQKSNEIQIEKAIRVKELKECEAEWMVKVAEKEEEILYLKKKSSKEGHGDHCNLNKEIDALRKYLDNVRKQVVTLSLPAFSEFRYDFKTSEILENTEFGIEKDQAEIIFDQLLQFKSLFKDNISLFGDEAIRPEEKKEDTEKLQSMEMELEWSEKLLEKSSEINNLEAQNSRKEEEIMCLRYLQKELENQVSSLQGEKDKLEEKLNNLNGDHLIVLSNKDELEVHLSELEHEKIQLSGKISSLEDVLRQLTVEKESNHLVFQDSQSCAMKLEGKIREMQNRMEEQRLDINKKLEEMQRQWLERVEECKSLKIANEKLQARNGSTNERLREMELEWSEKLLEKSSNINNLEAENSWKEEEIMGLRYCQKKLENQVSGLHDEKDKLEEKLNHLNEEHLMVLSNKDELEAHLSEVEHDKIQLSEKISRLEEVLRQLTVEKESNHLVLQDSQSCTMKLEGKISELENGMEEQRKNMNQKLEEMQRQWLERVEDCKSLKIANEELQARNESASEELREKMLEKSLEINKLVAEILQKGEEIMSLTCCQNELEIQISSLQEEEEKLEAKMKDLKEEYLLVVNGNVELEVQFLELENENIQLTERICGLEAVLRHLTDERESNHLALQNSKSQEKKLERTVRELESGMEAHRIDLNKKFKEMEKKWVEAVMECENLKIENEELRVKYESLSNEFSLLRISNGKVTKEKMDLVKHVTVLEREVGGAEEMFSDMLKEVEDLELKLSSMEEDISLKEKFLDGKLNQLIWEIEKNKENLARENSMLNQMYLKKAADVNTLQLRVSHLIEQMSMSYDEKERAASDALMEMDLLHGDKAVLDSALQEAEGKLKLFERTLDIIEKKSETKMQGLIFELAALKQNQGVLLADHGAKSRSLEDAKIIELKLKTILLELELKLKASESERIKLAEEISGLKIKLQKTEQVREEVSTLKKSLCEADIQKNRIKASFEALSGEYEELKTRRHSYIETISSMEKEVMKLEDCERSKVALEQKVLRLEWDVIAKESSCARDAKLKSELATMKRKNSQFQKKIKCLEEELRRSKEAEQDGEQQSYSIWDFSQFIQDDDQTQCLSTGSEIIGSSELQFLEHEEAATLDSYDEQGLQLMSLLTKEQNGKSEALEKLTSEDEVRKEVKSELSQNAEVEGQ